MVARSCLKQASLLCLMLAAGCAMRTPLHENGALARLWHERLAEYNIVSVFPPREDVQVGDIYLMCSPETGESEELSSVSRPLPTLVATVPGVSAELERYYAKRVTVPEITRGDDTNQAMIRVSSEGMGPFGATPGDNRRLRNVSMPEFFTVAASGGTLSALAPTPSVLAGGGLSKDSIESIAISVPAGSSYGMPVLDLLDLAQRIPQERLASLSGLLERQGQEDSNICANEKLVLINEIYFAHAIDVHFNFKDEAAASFRAAIGLSPDSKRKTTFDALAPSFASNINSDSEGDGSQHAATETSKGDAAEDSTKTLLRLADIDALEARMQAYLAATQGLGRLNQPGISVSVYGGAGSGVLLRRQFVNPVVIGYRGFELILERSSSGPSLIKVVGAGSISAGNTAATGGELDLGGRSSGSKK